MRAGAEGKGRSEGEGEGKGKGEGERAGGGREVLGRGGKDNALDLAQPNTHAGEFFQAEAKAKATMRAYARRGHSVEIDTRG